MLRCQYCKVNVAGDKVCCPLCGGTLTGVAEPETEVFPKIKKRRFTSNFILRLLALICIVVSTVCVFVNTQIASYVFWSLFVIAGAASFWIACAVGIHYKSDIAQNIGWQVILIPVLSILWDLGIGWRGWSIDFVLPCVCIAGMLTLLVLLVFLNDNFHSHIFSFIGTCGIGVIPLILYLFDKIKIIYPTFICSGLAIIIIAWLLLFRWKTVISEITRRFHI